MNDDMKDCLSVIRFNFAMTRGVVIVFIILIAMWIVLQYDFLYAIPFMLAAYLIVIFMLIRKSKTVSMANLHKIYAFLIASGIRRENIFRGYMISLMIPLPIVLLGALLYPVPEVTIWQKMLAACAFYIVISVVVMVSYVIDYKMVGKTKTIAILIALVIVCVTVGIVIFSISIAANLVFLGYGIVIAIGLITDVFLYRKGIEAIRAMDV